MPSPVRPPAGSGDVVYAERLWPSTATWLLAPGLAVGVAIALVPVGTTAAVAAGVVVAVAVALALTLASPQVEVAGGCLRAGRARVPLTLLGAATGYAGAAAREQRGPQLDARAYLCIRPWVDPVVRVELTDPQDPTPYWLVSTRSPERLVRALAHRS